MQNLKPSNDINLKIERARIGAIIAGGARVDKEGANPVPWLNVHEEVHDLIFNRDSLRISCCYVVGMDKCRIGSPTCRAFNVHCNNMDDFRHIITLVSCIAQNRCGSLKSTGPNGKASVRGLRESVLTYVKNGCPPVYQLEL